MAHSAILTIEPIALGGVPAMVRVVDGLLRRWGHTPTLIYSDAESVPTDGMLPLVRYFARHPLPRREIRDGLNGLAIPLWPLPQWLAYYAPVVAARRELAAAQVRLVVAGSAHTGLPLALSDRPFIAWVATLYEREIEARASVGDAWARRLLASRAWPILRRQEARVLERAAIVLALSPHTETVIRRLFPAIAPRVRTLLCPVDTNVFRPAFPPPLLGEGPGVGGVMGLYLLLTARIRDPRKNVDLLLRAFARVRAARPDVGLVITGDDPLQETQALADRLGVRRAVAFRGLAPTAELVRLYQSAALFTLPSLQEGLGISALEAMACGVPVVATRSGGPEGIVVEGQTGWLVPNDDDAAFAEAILRALAEPGRLRAMRENCRRYAEREFARPVVEEKLLAALRDVYPQHFASPPGPPLLKRAVPFQERGGG